MNDPNIIRMIEDIAHNTRALGVLAIISTAFIIVVGLVWIIKNRKD